MSSKQSTFRLSVSASSSVNKNNSIKCPPSPSLLLALLTQGRVAVGIARILVSMTIGLRVKVTVVSVAAVCPQRHRQVQHSGVRGKPPNTTAAFIGQSSGCGVQRYAVKIQNYVGELQIELSHSDAS